MAYVQRCRFSVQGGHKGLLVQVVLILPSLHRNILLSRVIVSIGMPKVRLQLSPTQSNLKLFSTHLFFLGIAICILLCFQMLEFL